MSNSLAKPSPFLQRRAHTSTAARSACGLCVGYEVGEWRSAALADHIMEWLPEFALSPKEFTAMQHANAVEFIRRAAKVVYNTEKFKKRGEFGELFLHAAIRQVYDSLPAISKIYYKSAINDTVKGFDAVHVVGPADDMELWLGEVKFYASIKAAVRDVVKEIALHLGTNYLKSEFLVIGNKVDDTWPHAPALRSLLSDKTSLDEVFKRACIPVLLTYDSDCVGKHSVCSADYIAAFEKEIAEYSDLFAKAIGLQTVPPDLKIHLFLMPLKEKAALVKALDGKLKTWQKL